MAQWTVRDGDLHVVVEVIGDQVKMDVVSGLPLVAGPQAVEQLRRALASAALAAHFGRRPDAAAMSRR